MTAGWVAVLSALGAAAVAVAAVAHRSRGRRMGSADLVVAGVVLAGVVSLVAVFGIVGPLDIFGVVAVGFAGAVLAVPATALGLLVVAAARRRDRAGASGGGAPAVVTRPALVVLVLGLVPALVGIDGSWVEPNRLERDDAGVVELPAGRDGDGAVRIVVLSDLQFTEVGDHEREAVDRALAEAPDLILIAGDLYQGDAAGFEDQLDSIKALLSRLHAPGGVFLVGGDVDRPVSRLPRMVAGTEVRLLADEVVTVRAAGREVTVGGISLDWSSPAARRVADRLESEPGDDVRILLAHRPDAVGLLPARAPRTDLVVAGHTHGGQIRVPLVGPLVTMTGVPRAVAAGGLHRMDERRIYVSPGVGVERGQAPRVRLGVPPSYGVLVLT